MPMSPFYPIGTPGLPWGEAERQAWRARQRRQRSYADDVLRRVQALSATMEPVPYGTLVYGDDTYPLQALRSAAWNPALPVALVTGGVHGYETSGVWGALQFAECHAGPYQGRVNLLLAPCVSPWAYERICRWNFDAVDPNRSFGPQGGAAESAALLALIQPYAGQFLLHIDLHETTDTDATEYRPAVAARDGLPFEPARIPDGFYLASDIDDPQPGFQAAVIRAVAGVTHIAPADARGMIIDSPVLSEGVIGFPVRRWGLCASITAAPFSTTTEVYPDSPRTTPEQCVAAQVAAVCAALDYALSAHR